MIGFKNMDPFFQYPIYSANHAGIQFFNNNSMLNSISKIDRGQYMYTGALEFNGAPLTTYEPVPFEVYVEFSFLNYFLAFIGILILQTFTILIIDIFWLKNMPSTVTLWEKLVHVVQKSHIPFPFANWHEGKGSCLDHIKRKKLGEKEVLMATIVNLAFNMVMLIPLVILCKNRNLLYHLLIHSYRNFFLDQGILVRHNQLKEHLGVFDMEQESFDRSQLLAWVLFPTWIVMSIFQTGCFHLANNKFHPLAAILKDCD